MKPNTKQALYELKERSITFLYLLPVLGLLWAFRNSIGLTAILCFYLGRASTDRVPFSIEREIEIRGNAIAISLPVWSVILLVYFFS